MSKSSQRSLKMRKRKNSKKIFIVFGICGVLLIIIAGKFLLDTLRITPILFQLLFQKEDFIKKENRPIQILLLGTAGGTHDGPNLTDTIMLASVDDKNKKVSIISLPRDLWVQDLQAKINTVYAFGEKSKKGGGIFLVKTVVSKITNQPIDYVLQIDFNGFVKAVDLIGGIDVDVANTFDDYQYPVEENREDLCRHTLDEATALIATMSPQMVFPCRYAHVHFDNGLQHMNGKTALVFVRSRYAEGIEGSDFARSKRQEKIISAFRQKVFSVGTFLNVGKMIELYNILQDSIDTDIKEEEFDDFIRLAQKMKGAEFYSIVLDYGDEKSEGLLINPPISEEYKMQWVLAPRIGSGDFSEIHTYIACVLSHKVCEVKPLYEKSTANTQGNSN